MQPNEYLVVKIGLETAEIGPPQVCCVITDREPDLGSFSVPLICAGRSALCEFVRAKANCEAFLTGAVVIQFGYRRDAAFLQFQ